MLFTVFTPTYNRAGLLPRVYDSLTQQTFKDFEWIIVDDGSTDHTAAIVDELIRKSEEVGFSIRYFYKENGGKHTAHNLGAKEALGELFFIVDSDDVLPDNALEIVAEEWKKLSKDNSFAGVCGLDADMQTKQIIGSGLPKDIIDGYYADVKFGYHLRGDMKEVYLAEALREFPFPEIDGESFCPEILVWNRIGSKYKLRFVNRVIYFAEYQSTGITSYITKIRMKSPIATMMTYAEMTHLSIPFVHRLKSAINYWRFFFCRKLQKTCVPKISFLWLWTLPLGLIMHLRDKKFLKGQ